MIDEIIKNVMSDIEKMLSAKNMMYLNEHKVGLLIKTVLKANISTFVNEFQIVNNNEKIKNIEEEIEKIKNNCLWKPLYNYKNNTYIEINDELVK